MFKKFFITLFFITLFLPLQNISAKNQDDINIYFFWGNGCPHCEKEKIFLEKIKNKYSNVVVYDFEVWKNNL